MALAGSNEPLNDRRLLVADSITVVDHRQARALAAPPPGRPASFHADVSMWLREGIRVRDWRDLNVGLRGRGWSGGLH